MSFLPEQFGALQAFVFAADRRSFTGAAQQLGLTSSAVGKAIQRLEEQLSVRLFHRSTRSISLTEEGALFLERCRHILAELEAAQAELAGTGTQASGRLKVSLPIASSLFLPAIAAFSAAYPAIELQLDFDDRFVDMIDEGYDVVIRSGEPQDSRLMYRQLGTFTWQLVASPAYVQAHGQPRVAHDLRNHQCIRHRFPQTGKLIPWPTESDGASVAPAAITANMMDAIVTLAESGCGIACLPQFAVRQQIRDGRLIRILDHSPRAEGTLGLLWPASRFPWRKCAPLLISLRCTYPQ